MAALVGGVDKEVTAEFFDQGEAQIDGETGGVGSVFTKSTEPMRVPLSKSISGQVD